MEIASLLKSEEVYELVEIILNEQFSKEVSDIGKDLLYNGISSIPEIQSRLRLSFESVKNVLIILMQNKLCSSTELIKKDTKVIGYEILIDNVLNVLFFPKILYLGKNKFGEYATMIFEEFMQFGILSSLQVFEQVKNKIEKTKKFNNAIMNKIKITFINLIEGNYIVQAKKVTDGLKEKEKELRNKNKSQPKKNGKSKKDNKKTSKKEEKKVDKKEKKSKSQSKKKNGKKKKNDSDEEDISDNDEEESDDDNDFKLLKNSKKVNKKKAIESEKNKKSKKTNKFIGHLSASESDDLKNDPSSSSEEEEPATIKKHTNNTKKDSSPVEENIDETNSLLFNKESNTYFYFFFNYDQFITDFKSQIVVEFITQKISPQAGAVASLFLEKNPINSFKNGKTIGLTYSSISSRYKSIDINSIDEILADPNDFFMKISSDTYTLNLEEVGNYIKARTIEKIILQKFTQNHVRIFRLLFLCGALDAKNIMDICLILPKNANMILNQLYSEGFIETQTVNVKGSNILFYSVNMTNNIQKMVDETYKMIKNLKKYLIEELENIKNRVSPSMQEQYITKIYSAISQLGETAIVLKDF